MNKAFSCVATFEPLLLTQALADAALSVNRALTRVLLTHLGLIYYFFEFSPCLYADI